ncbi:UNVERIFIED_CONTAM: Cytochrome b-c1 complex subunit [Sesamum calycinum]|uniref:Cytochrome b-c1 complex subunit n=1 Tax=Sesamum calycinum TaxID=2727403 RepID=A0AAW2LC67_9LAMI
MGKQPDEMKAVVYALSPFQQKVMPGLWKDLPGKIGHKISENWISATLLLGPLVGTYSCRILTNKVAGKSKVKETFPIVSPISFEIANMMLLNEADAANATCIVSSECLEDVIHFLLLCACFNKLRFVRPAAAAAAAAAAAVVIC